MTHHIWQTGFLVFINYTSRILTILLECVPFNKRRSFLHFIDNVIYLSETKRGSNVKESLAWTSKNVVHQYYILMYIVCFPFTASRPHADLPSTSFCLNIEKTADFSLYYLLQFAKNLFLFCLLFIIVSNETGLDVSRSFVRNPKINFINPYTYTIKIFSFLLFREWFKIVSLKHSMTFPKKQS